MKLLKLYSNHNIAVTYFGIALVVDDENGKWIATNCDGRVFSYYDCPKVGDLFWYGIGSQLLAQVDLVDTDWKQTLISVEHLVHRQTMA